MPKRRFTARNTSPSAAAPASQTVFAIRAQSVFSTVGAVTVAVVLLGIPLAFYGARLVRDAELRDLADRAAALGRQVETRLGADRPITADLLEIYVRGDDGALPAAVSVVAPDGTRVRAGEPIEGRAYPAVVRTESGAVVLLTMSWWDVFWRT